MLQKTARELRLWLFVLSLLVSVPMTVVFFVLFVREVRGMEQFGLGHGMDRIFAMLGTSAGFLVSLGLTILVVLLRPRRRR